MCESVKYLSDFCIRARFVVTLEVSSLEAPITWVINSGINKSCSVFMLSEIHEKHAKNVKSLCQKWTELFSAFIASITKRDMTSHFSWNVVHSWDILLLVADVCTSSNGQSAKKEKKCIKTALQSVINRTFTLISHATLLPFSFPTFMEFLECSIYVSVVCKIHCKRFFREAFERTRLCMLNISLDF